MIGVPFLFNSVIGALILFRDKITYLYITNEILSNIKNGGKLKSLIPLVIVKRKKLSRTNNDKGADTNAKQELLECTRH